MYHLVVKAVWKKPCLGRDKEGQGPIHLEGSGRLNLMEGVSIGEDLEERGFFVYMKMEGEETS